MTVETQTMKVTANGNDVATTFSFSPIVIFESTDIVVTKTTSAGVESTLSEGATSTTYSVTVSSYPGTGSITYPASGGTPLATGETITIKRVLTLEQTLDLENQGGYFADLQETAFDKLVMIDLQQQEELNRSLKLPISADLADLEELSAALLTVAAIDTEVSQVAAVDNETATVAGISANVTTVAGISANVTTVAGISANVTTVAGVSGNVTTVAGNSANVTTVAGVSGNVTTVAGISANVTTVAGISANVTTVANASADVTAVAAVAADLPGVLATASLKYLFDSSTTMADPGTGDLRLNNAAIASTTAIALSNTFSGGSDISDLIATWDNATHTPAAVLTVRKAGDADFFATFGITAVTDNGAWLQLTASFIATGGGTLSAADALYLGVSLSGDNGTGVGDLLAANNLSDVANAGTARTNLGLVAGGAGDIWVEKAGDSMTGDLTMTGASIFQAEGAAVASVAGTTDIWAVSDGDTIHVTGVEAITSLGTAPQAGAWKHIIADGAFTLTQGANLNLNAGGANITMAVDDVAFVYADTTTQMDVCVIRKSGAAVVSSGGFTAVTPVATTSGTSVTIASSIPSGTKLIIVSLNGVSFTAGDLAYYIQIGDSGGLETTSYNSSVISFGTGLGTQVADTTGFILMPTGVVPAAQSLSGQLILSRESGTSNTWTAHGQFISSAGDRQTISVGVKALSAELDRLAILGGTFDAGEVSCIYAS